MKCITKLFIGFFIIGLLLIPSCVKDPNVIPYVKVSFNISPENGNLVHVGGYEYYTGGVSGLVVYRLDMLNFCAYDRACSHDWQDSDSGYVVYDPAFLHLKCKTCGSTFNILNGYPMEGSPAEFPLRIYQARLINEFTLHISN